MTMKEEFSAIDMATAAADGFRDGQRAEHAELAAHAAETAPGWISAEDRLPDSGRAVLAYYLNSHGMGRRVRAALIARHTVETSHDAWGDGADYDEATDTYYSPAGWYECVDNWDELAYLFINEGTVTHWIPLPAPPKQIKEQGHE